MMKPIITDNSPLLLLLIILLTLKGVLPVRFKQLLLAGLSKSILHFITQMPEKNFMLIGNPISSPSFLPH
jgi:hypothetical protein